MNRTSKISFTILVLTVVFILSTGSSNPVLGQAHTGGTFELVAGWYLPESDALDDDLTYGIRGGYRFSESFGFEGSLTVFETDLANTSIGVDFLLADVSFKWYPGSAGSKSELVLFGGPGWANIDIDVGGFFGSVSEDSVTAHLGLAGELSLSESIYLRPDLRARWIEETEDVDLEGTLALGFRF